MKSVDENRVNWIDFCRGGGMLLVLLGHTAFPFRSFVYGFHMPLFFVVSGLVYHEAKVCPFVKYAKKLLVPYGVYAVINLICDLLFHIKEIDGYPLGTKIIGLLYSRGTIIWMPNCSPIWFLTCMFVALCIMYVVTRLNSDLLKHICVAVCAIVSYVLYILGVPKLLWNVDTALMAVLFIWIGFQLKYYIIYKINLLTAICLGLIGSMSIFLNPGVEFNNNTYGNLFLMLFGAVGVCILAVKISSLIGNSNGKISSYIQWIGKNTIFFLSFDYLVGAVSRSLLNRMNLNEWMFVLVMKIILLSVGCFVWNYIRDSRLKEKIL